MPVNLVPKDYLVKNLKDIQTEDDIDNLCFEFGTEYDGSVVDEEGVTQWRIEVAANRYDLLSPEGIVQALGVFQGISTPPVYTIEPAKETLTVDASAASIRPFCVAAIVRDVELDEMAYQSFIDLQDKLHHNICRRRELVSVGTHDLDTITGPFRYTAETPDTFSFKPLNQEETMSGTRLMEFYSDHPQLKAFLPIIRDSPKYPIIRDANNTVLSLPPIINGDHSKMSTNTRNVFIEVTALDATKARIVLHVLIASLSMHAKKQFSVEQVNVKYEQDWSSGLTQAQEHTSIDFKSYHNYDGSCRVTPDMEEAKFSTTASYIQRVLGIEDPEFDRENMCMLLNKMLLKATCADDDEDRIDVVCPITRSDVLHECDIAEDAGIAYGYNRIQAKFLSAGSERGMGSLDHQIRQWMGQAGFNEILNWGLVGRSDSFANFGKNIDDAVIAHASTVDEAKIQYCPYTKPAVLDNSKSSEFEIIRTSLLGGMLKTLAHNTAARQPIQMFEIGNTVGQLSCPIAQSVNRNYFAALFASNTSAGFETIHGILDYIMMKLQTTPSYYELMDEHNKSTLRVRNGLFYKIEANDEDTAFIKNRSVRVVVCKDKECKDELQTVGRFGILKPSVIGAYNIQMPVSALEITLEPFMQWMPEVDQMDE